LKRPWRVANVKNPKIGQHVEYVVEVTCIGWYEKSETGAGNIYKGDSSVMPTSRVLKWREFKEKKPKIKEMTDNDE
jgi:hypothetical protein